MIERAPLTAAVAALGLVVGYLAQRSRMCFVAGFRDFLLVRDRELLRGFFAFVATIWVLTTALYSVGLMRKGAPEYGGIVLSSEEGVRRGTGGSSESGTIQSFFFTPALDRFMLVTFAGGWIIGILSTFAGGCVMRQHVLAAQGNRDSLFYLFGFFSAVPVFYLFLERFFARLY
jgi:hypothetical protein